MTDHEPESGMTGDASRYEEETGFVFHPAAAIFPMMPGEEIDQLAADIEANTLHDNLVMCEDMLLDGRNRAVACARLGKDTRNRVTIIAGVDPVAYVIGKNLRRRHLTPAQIDLAALALARAGHGGHRHGSGRKSAIGEQPEVECNSGNQSSGGKPNLKGKPEMTRAKAAGYFGIGIDRVNTAATVQKRALPEIKAAIASGRIKTTGHAYAIVNPDPDEERAGLTSEDKQRKWIADPKNGLKRRKPWTPRPAAPITPSALKGLSKDQAVAVAIKIATKFDNRQWADFLADPAVRAAVERALAA